MGRMRRCGRSAQVVNALEALMFGGGSSSLDPTAQGSLGGTQGVIVRGPFRAVR